MSTDIEKIETEYVQVNNSLTNIEIFIGSKVFNELDQETKDLAIEIRIKMTKYLERLYTLLEY